MSSHPDETNLMKARRNFVAAGAASLTLAAAGKYTLAAASAGDSMPAAQSDPRASTNALVFDVFGTVVDWRGSIIREGQLLGKRKGIDVDWVAFADAWRGGYRPAMQRVRSGQIPWMNIDGLNRLILNDLIRSVQHQGIVRRRNRSLQPCLAPAVALARFRGRIAPLELGLHRVDPVQRQREPVDQHGEVRRVTLELHLVCGTIRPLQARSRSLSGRRQAARSCAGPGHDGGGPRGRSQSGKEGRLEDGAGHAPARVRAPAKG